MSPRQRCMDTALELAQGVWISQSIMPQRFCFSDRRMARKAAHSERSLTSARAL